MDMRYNPHTSYKRMKGELQNVINLHQLLPCNVRIRVSMIRVALRSSSHSRGRPSQVFVYKILGLP